MNNPNQNSEIPMGLRNMLEESERAFTQTLNRLGLGRQELGQVAGRMRNSLGAAHHRPIQKQAKPSGQNTRRGYHV
ncbi:MAG: hypothetical protein JRF33_11350 [Deltaproteobacteria bacterium]|nr:hypothetical protein [Deltaproteobacteria bacterium]